MWVVIVQGLDDGCRIYELTRQVPLTSSSDGHQAGYIPSQDDNACLQKNAEYHLPLCIVTLRDLSRNVVATKVCSAGSINSSSPPMIMT